jgi:hypothetical protein
MGPAEYEVITAVTMKNAVFWHMSSQLLALFLARGNFTLKMEATLPPKCGFSQDPSQKTVFLMTMVV